MLSTIAFYKNRLIGITGSFHVRSQKEFETTPPQI